jgi:hypothetical protein
VDVDKNSSMSGWRAWKRLRRGMSQRRQRADSQLRPASGESAERIGDRGQRGHDRSGQLLPLVRQFEAATGADEQRHAEPALQLPGQMGKCRGTHRQFPRRIDNGTRPCNGTECLHGAQWGRHPSHRVSTDN